MPIRDALSSRLLNCKFTQALHALEAHDPEDVKRLVLALNAVFGDVGVGVLHGYMGHIVEAALASIGVKDEG